MEDFDGVEDVKFQEDVQAAKLVQSIQNQKDVILKASTNPPHTIQTIQILTEILVNVYKKLNEFEDSVDPFISRFKDKKKEANELRNQVEGLKNEVSSHKYEIEGYKKALEASKKEYEGLKWTLKDLADAKSHAEVLKSSLETSKNDFERLRKDLEDAKKENEGLKKFTKDFEGARKEADDLKISLETSKNDFEKLRKDLKNAKVENEGLKRFVNDFETAKREADDLRGMLEASKNECKMLRRDLDGVKKENEGLKVSLMDNEDLQSQIDRLKRELEDAKKVVVITECESCYLAAKSKGQSTSKGTQATLASQKRKINEFQKSLNLNQDFLSDSSEESNSQKAKREKRMSNALARKSKEKKAPFNPFENNPILKKFFFKNKAVLKSTPIPTRTLPVVSYSCPKIPAEASSSAGVSENPALEEESQLPKPEASNSQTYPKNEG